jgi:hypothetical protein
MIFQNKYINLFQQFSNTMTKMFMYMFIKNESGTDALPMRFVAAALLLAVVVALSAASLADFTRDAQVIRFSGDLTSLDSRASTIYQQFPL